MLVRIEELPRGYWCQQPCPEGSAPWFECGQQFQALGSDRPRQQCRQREKSTRVCGCRAWMRSTDGYVVAPRRRTGCWTEWLGSGF